MVRRGSPSRRPIAVADTASGGATIAPSVSAAATVSSGTVLYATKPTANVVASGRPDRQQPDRTHVLAQRDIAALQARRPQQRRQDDVQHQLRVELDLREAGNQCWPPGRRPPAPGARTRRTAAPARPTEPTPPEPPAVRHPRRQTSSVVIRILGQHAEEITRARCAVRRGPRTCEHLDAAAILAEPEPRTPGTLRGLQGGRREHVGTPADVPDLWARRLLRLQPAPARQRTLPADRTSGDALRRTGRGLAVVLHRRPAGLTIWQAGRAMSETTELPETERSTPETEPTGRDADAPGRPDPR